MGKLAQLKRHLKPGHVYRREDLAQWSNAIDRHLKELMGDGTLTKLAPGLYLYPKKTVVGKTPTDDENLVGAFLKDTRFLLASPNAYNMLGVGTTQLYNKTVVYNHKRHGSFMLGGRAFDFRVRPSFPTRLSAEFLLVDLVNNLDRLAESKKEVLERVRERAQSLDVPRLQMAAREYGNVGTKKFFLALTAGPGASAKCLLVSKLLEDFANFRTWRDAESSIRIQEGPPPLPARSVT
jgi:hypothetical protein